MVSRWQVWGTTGTDVRDGFGDFTQKLRLAASSGHPLDVVTTGWVNSYVAGVATGALRPLDDVLPAYAPKLRAHFPKGIWDASRVTGAGQ